MNVETAKPARASAESEPERRILHFLVNPLEEREFVGRKRHGHHQYSAKTLLHHPRQRRGRLFLEKL